MDLDYEKITTLVATIVFVGSWIYCVSAYGYLFGVGLGWLPSLIVAGLAALLWPLILLLLVLGGMLLAVLSMVGC